VSRDSDDALTQAKLVALAEFAAGAGHEINNPLATILGRTELLLRRVARVTPTGETAEAARDLHIIAGQVQRIRDMIGDMMLFARPPAPKFEPVDLAGVVRETVSSLQSEISRHEVTLDADLPTAGPIRADRTQVAIVVSELLRNALQATPAGGRIRIQVTSGAPDLRLVIEDNGAGLSEADRQHLFDPFYSGRQAGRGLGFGLCKCWRIVKEHGGSISVSPRDGAGVRAAVEWPAASQ
jgi:signal transduction histidine kinase